MGAGHRATRCNPRTPINSALPPPRTCAAELGLTALQSIHTECDVHGTKLLQARVCGSSGLQRTQPCRPALCMPARSSHAPLPLPRPITPCSGMPTTDAWRACRARSASASATTRRRRRRLWSRARWAWEPRPLCLCQRRMHAPPPRHLRLPTICRWRLFATCPPHQVEGFLEELLLLCQRSEEYLLFLLARMGEGGGARAAAARARDCAARRRL